MKRSDGVALSAGLFSAGWFFTCFFGFLVMAIGTPFIVVETVRAKFGMAARTPFHAADTVILLTAFTSPHTSATGDGLAERTVEIAVAADSHFTVLAGPPLVVTDPRRAVRALLAVPLGNCHIRAVRVVSSQQIGDDQKEIQQTALLERLLDWPVSFAFANGFVLDVRVGDALVGSSRIGVDGNDAIVTRMAARQITPVEADLEGAE